jgi:Protein kinase domain
LHEHGIVHRDLKPGNLFIENGIVKIGDYGLSKFISASRRSGQTVSIGSVHYMAPEMSQGRYGKEVDQYALGIILCEMLTGRVPFDGESQGEILMKHLTADPELGRLTEPYRSVVARLLDKDPRNRYPAVQDLLAELPALNPAMPGGVPGSVAAGSPGQQAQSQAEFHAAVSDLPAAESEPANPCSDKEAGVKAHLRNDYISVVVPPVDMPDGEYAVGSLNGATTIKLKGKCKTLTVGLVDGASTLDASGLTAKEIIFTDKIDGRSTVKLNAPNGSVDFRKKVDGQSTLEVVAAGGTVTFSDPGGFLNAGSKIDGKSKVRITAKVVDFKAKIDGGPETHVLVTLTAGGTLRFKEINGKCRLHYRKADAKDPDPSIEAGTIDGQAELKNVE